MKHIIIILFLVSSLSFGQYGNGFSIGDAPVFTPAQIGVGTIFYKVDIEGTPYVDEIYRSGKIFISGKELTTSLMRYNAYSDQIEILGNYRRIIFLQKKENVQAELNGTTINSYYAFYEYAHS